MTTRAARWLVFAYLAAYTIFLVYPGILPFNRSHPLVLGMPFVMVWVSSWVLLGVLVSWVLERATTRAEDAAAHGRDTPRRDG